VTNNYVKAVVRPKTGRAVQTFVFFDSTSEESIKNAQDKVGTLDGELSIYHRMAVSFPGVPKIGAEVAEA
jgi:hypothetical protein